MYARLREICQAEIGPDASPGTIARAVYLKKCILQIRATIEWATDKKSIGWIIAVDNIARKLEADYEILCQ
jgi:hypothetical protein